MVLTLTPILIVATVVAAQQPAAKPFELRRVLDAATPDSETVTLKQRGHVETLFLVKKPLMDQTAIQSATVKHGSEGKPEIHLVFTEAGRKLFSEITSHLIGKRIAILISETYMRHPSSNHRSPAELGSLPAIFPSRRLRSLHPSSQRPQASHEA